MKGCFFVYLRNCLFCPHSLSIMFIVWIMHRDHGALPNRWKSISCSLSSRYKKVTRGEVITNQTSFNKETWETLFTYKWKTHQVSITLLINMFSSCWFTVFAGDKATPPTLTFQRGKKKKKKKKEKKNEWTEQNNHNFLENTIFFF